MRHTFTTALVFATFGGIAGFFIACSDRVTVKAEIPLGDLVQAGATIAVALIVSKLWRDHYFKIDTAKTLMMHALPSVRKNAADIRAEFVEMQAGGVWDDNFYDKVLMGFRDLSNNVGEIEGIGNAVFGPRSCDDLRAAIRDLKRSCTSHTPGPERLLPDMTLLDRAFGAFQRKLGAVQATILAL